MTRRAVLLALLVVVPAGCITFDDDRSVTVELLVTEEMGTRTLSHANVTVPANASVLDALRRAHTVETAHGGGFVEAIDGRASGYPDVKVDWFYHVDTALADVGAADRALAEDALVVWDRRPWNHTMGLEHVLTGLDAWPGERTQPPVETTPEAWRENASQPHTADTLFARVDGDRLTVLDANATPARTLEPPWLIAHAVDGPGPAPTLLVVASGADGRGLAEQLDEARPRGLGVVATPNGTLEVPAG